MKVKLYLVINDTTGKFLKVYQMKHSADNYALRLKNANTLNHKYKVIEVIHEYDFSGYEEWSKQ